MKSVSSGYFFFTALGAVTGFISGALTAMATGQDKETWFDTAMHSAIGGAIAGAGVDVGLLIIGSCGTALPAVTLAAGVAFVAGGIGNAYTTDATSNGKATDEDMMKSFLIGGAFNTVSLATSMSAVSSNTQTLWIAGTNSLEGNLKVGTTIAIATSAATVIGTTDYANKKITNRTKQPKISIPKRRLRV